MRSCRMLCEQSQGNQKACEMTDAYHVAFNELYTSDFTFAEELLQVLDRRCEEVDASLRHS